jgi:hypothetical protein
LASPNKASDFLDRMDALNRRPWRLDTIVQVGANLLASAQRNLHAARVHGRTVTEGVVNILENSFSCCKAAKLKQDVYPPVENTHKVTLH